jgi:myo-inositol-1(or 4)-monophosphatase
VIYAPVLGERYTAVRGAGATLNGTRLRLQPGNELRSGLLEIGANERVPTERVGDTLEALTKASVGWVRHGSGVLMLACFAAGRRLW